MVGVFCTLYFQTKKNSWWLAGVFCKSYFQKNRLDLMASRFILYIFRIMGLTWSPAAVAGRMLPSRHGDDLGKGKGLLSSWKEKAVSKSFLCSWKSLWWASWYPWIWWYGDKCWLLCIAFTENVYDFRMYACLLWKVRNILLLEYFLWMSKFSIICYNEICVDFMFDIL